MLPRVHSDCRLACRVRKQFLDAFLSYFVARGVLRNLTLLGSVANLIVAQIVRGRGIELSFRGYLKAGVPITIGSMAIGVIWLSLRG